MRLCESVPEAITLRVHRHVGSGLQELILVRLMLFTYLSAKIDGTSTGCYPTIPIFSIICLMRKWFDFGGCNRDMPDLLLLYSLQSNWYEGELGCSLEWCRHWEVISGIFLFCFFFLLQHKTEEVPSVSQLPSKELLVSTTLNEAFYFVQVFF